jgi:surface protein
MSFNKSFTRDLSVAEEWVRNPEWVTLPTVTTGDNTFVGLYAIHPDIPNHCALRASGNYTVDWGDGTAPENVNSAVTAEHTYNYDDVDLLGTTVGAVDAVDCTFQDTEDTVTVTDHLFQNGHIIQFATINSTTGISIDTKYYVRDRTVNTFKVSATRGGDALTLTTDGTGTVYAPMYRQAVIVITMQSAQTFTSISLDFSHSATSTINFSGLPWLDIIICGASLTIIDLNMGYNRRLSRLEQVTIIDHSMINMANMFIKCFALQSVPLFNTASVTNMSSMFNSCSALQSVPLFNTASVTNMSSMFNGCGALQSVPLFNTTEVIGMSSMFNLCYSLQSVPLFDTAKVTSMNSMFNNCTSLQSVPLFNTAAVTTMSSMFASCSSLQSVPLFNTTLVDIMSNMFNVCYSLQSVPLFNTAAVTTMASMFQSCLSLQSVPLFDTANVTAMNSMFNACYTLQSVPLFNTAAVTTMASMFGNCYSLRELPALNFSAATNTTSAFVSATSISRIPITPPAISFSVTGLNLDANALNELYTNLPNATATLTVTNCPGIAADDPTIATAKGWTVVS